MDCRNEPHKEERICGRERDAPALHWNQCNQLSGGSALYGELKGAPDCATAFPRRAMNLQNGSGSHTGSRGLSIHRPCADTTEREECMKNHNETAPAPTIESHNNRLRVYLARLRRKTHCYTKKLEPVMHFPCN